MTLTLEEWIKLGILVIVAILVLDQIKIMFKNAYKEDYRYAKNKTY